MHIDVHRCVGRLLRWAISLTEVNLLRLNVAPPEDLHLLEDMPKGK